MGMSPAVDEYNKRQNAVIAQMKARAGDASAQAPAAAVAHEEDKVLVPASDFIQHDRSYDAVETPGGTATEFRCLALISHNNMKPAMQDFVQANKEVLKHFRLTGTNSTMTMLRSVLGDD